MPRQISYSLTLAAFNRGEITEDLLYIRTRAACRRGDVEARAIANNRGWRIPGSARNAARAVRNVVRQALRALRVERFGIEIEFTGDPRRVVTEARSLGLAITSETYNHTVRDYWKIVSDGSCGWELVSPPLQKCDASFETIKTACQALRRAGAAVNRNCGLHIHLEARAFNAAQIKNLIRSYTANQALVNSVLARSRHNAYYASPYQLPELVAIEPALTVEEMARRICERRKTVNLQSFTRYGTVEFRQHQGSHNAEKITRWIEFVIAIAETASRQEIAQQSNLQAFMSAINLSAEAQSFFTERAMELAP